MFDSCKSVKYGIVALSVLLGDNIHYSNQKIRLHRLNESKPIEYEIHAAKECLKKAKIRPADIDLIISSSTLNEYLAPGNACIIQDEIKASKAISFSIEANCASFIFAVSIAESLGYKHQFKNALLVLSSFYSRTIGQQADILNYSDATCAILLSNNAAYRKIMDVKIITRGDVHNKKVVIRNNTATQLSDCEYSMKDISNNDLSLKSISIDQVPNLGFSILKKNNIEVHNTTALFLHQSPLIPLWINNSLGSIKIIPNLYSEYGNLGMVNIPFLLDQYDSSTEIIPSDKVLCLTPGIGWHSAGMIIDW